MWELQDEEPLEGTTAQQGEPILLCSHQPFILERVLVHLGVILGIPRTQTHTHTRSDGQGQFNIASSINATKDIFM